MTAEMSEKEVKYEAFKLCQEFLGRPWTDISISDFNISTVSGGVSNDLYCCSLPNDLFIEDSTTPRRVLLRFYGPLQEEENKKVTETTTFVILSEKKLGPKLYGVFPNGRIEEYIPSKHLASSDFRRFSSSIAKSMAKIHALSLPLRKSPDTWLNHMTQWLKDIENFRAQEFNEHFPLRNMFKEEIDFLIKEIKNYDSPSVFCHNDLVQGNILLPHYRAKDLEPNLIFIDFEFGGYNSRSHDIANHLCEWAYDYDVAEPPYFTFDINRYPTEEEKTKFVRAYVTQLVQENVLKPTAVDAETDKILKELEFFNMVTQLYWAVGVKRTNMIQKLAYSIKKIQKLEWKVIVHSREVF